MVLLTRQEIIDIWSKLSEEDLNSFCCPNCRDLLYYESGTYYCYNSGCYFESVSKGIVEELK